MKSIEIATFCYHQVTLLTLGFLFLAFFSQVYIEVLNVNDNVPLTLEPVYYPHVSETTPAHSPVMSLMAFDRDLEKNKTITYRITGGNGNALNLFSIDSASGKYDECNNM